MAAIAAYNLDNLIIEVSSHEIPILDGSSWQYCQAFDEVGVIRQNVLRSYFVIKSRCESKAPMVLQSFYPLMGAVLI